ncbi:hypothetical protein IC575_005581 [Cucumis melo]|uniref:Uncharacterized protein n=1 Tax=Cucumis melo TaxID=3656 RepID=A0A9I9E7P3_CUCME
MEQLRLDLLRLRTMGFHSRLVRRRFRPLLPLPTARGSALLLYTTSKMLGPSPNPMGRSRSHLEVYEWNKFKTITKQCANLKKVKETYEPSSHSGSTKLPPPLTPGIQDFLG